jgi:hypothetical protein
LGNLRDRIGVDRDRVCTAAFAARPALMDATQIALLALYVSIFALVVSAAASMLEMRRWFDEGVKLLLSLMPDAQMLGGATPITIPT